MLLVYITYISLSVLTTLSSYFILKDFISYYINFSVSAMHICLCHHSYRDSFIIMLTQSNHSYYFHHVVKIYVHINNILIYSFIFIPYQIFISCLLHKSCMRKFKSIKIYLLFIYVKVKDHWFFFILLWITNYINKKNFSLTWVFPIFIINVFGY
jgi:hypothetical protein